MVSRLKTWSSPCEMCYSHPGEPGDGFILCFGCRRDITRVLSFLENKGFNVIDPKTYQLDEATGELKVVGIISSRPSKDGP